MYFRIIFLGAIFFANYCAASELMVYRWIDKNNVVHFSQHQPLDDDYTELIVSSQSKINSRANLDTSSSPIKKVTPTQEKITIEKTKAMSDKCKEAKENLAMLKAFENVQYTDENGKNQLLNKKEKKLQLEINQKRTEIYCTP